MGATQKIRVCKIMVFGLEQFRVYAHGVLVATTWSEQGARARAAEYLRRLTRV